jgi:hypothetical protein
MVAGRGIAKSKKGCWNESFLLGLVKPKSAKLFVHISKLFFWIILNFYKVVH